MSTRDYRRQIEAEIAAAKTAADEPRWGARVEEAGGLDHLGLAAGGEEDSARLRETVEDPGAPIALRLAAFGHLVEGHSDPGTVHAYPLALLGDGSEDPALRSAALHSLKVAAFHSPTAAEWRPEYVEALRSASKADDESLRLEAFEVLAAMKDRPSQEALMVGLEDAGKALISPEHALRLLADDPHTRVRERARDLADTSPDHGVRMEAMRVLAGDPESAPRFRSWLLDSSAHPAVRKMAATALGNLDPNALRGTLEELEGPPAADVEADPEAEPAAGGDEHVRKHVQCLLEQLD